MKPIRDRAQLKSAQDSSRYRVLATSLLDMLFVLSTINMTL